LGGAAVGKGDGALASAPLRLLAREARQPSKVLPVESAEVVRPEVVRPLWKVEARRWCRGKW
jgi:hypothetical protein